MSARRARRSPASVARGARPRGKPGRRRRRWKTPACSTTRARLPHARKSSASSKRLATIGLGVRHALAAIDGGKHIIMVNVEADVLCGPLLAARARAKNLVYSMA